MFVSVASNGIVARVSDYKTLHPIWEVFSEKISIELLPINGEILAKAHDKIAYIGKNRSLKLTDAIHLATAQAAGCTHFFTNDKRLPALEGMEMVWVEA